VPSRRKTREFVLQVLFAADAQQTDPHSVLALFETHFRADEDEILKLQRVVMEFARELVGAVERDRQNIDNLISRLSCNWKLYRMNRVDRNILRMAIAEMANFPDIPGRVTLDEAVDLGKRYGTEDSAAFINGILDRVHALSIQPPPPRDVKEIISRLDELGTTN
jgi:transcription antitermination protein NusB